MKMKISISRNIWQPYHRADGFKDFIQPWRVKVRHWMKTLIVISYAMKFSQISMERNIAHPGD
jgi:hypothetical protein